MDKITNLQGNNYLRHSQNLVKLGLTKQEASLYLVLLQKGTSTIKSIAKETKLPINSIYRSAKSLEDKKLIGILNTHPQCLKAFPPQFTLPTLAEETGLKLHALAEETSSTLNLKSFPSFSDKIDLILGQDKIFQFGERMAQTTKKELLIISIGENVPPNLLLANKKAHDRGVPIRMIAHKYDEENKHILENFKKNGYEIRHLPGSGFHLAISDSTISLLIINNPEKISERVAAKIISPGLSSALKDYFYSVWAQAIAV